MALLTPEEIRARLTALPDWHLAADGIRKTYSFPDFRKAINFVNAVADIAEARQHHPEIAIRYNKVTLTSLSHDVGQVTERDLELAEQLEQIPL
ncbi:MAG: 4a-hydroxytetrahydrobiopterin dehydratase [Armatimonadetes bacterium]|jgi:4a-hydroxytetrahydrobiopterin dehydratase|nr:4a-hydroxytetrahydrobiopterin dehydratase [Armatimonadota bacterium]